MYIGFWGSRSNECLQENSFMTNFIPGNFMIKIKDINVFNLLNFEKIGAVNEKDNVKWLEYFSGVILLELNNTLKKVSNVAFKQDIGLNKDQKKIVKYLKKNGVITDSDYSKITERKKATRVLDFNKLIFDGLIERRGQGRLTHYILN